MPMIPHKTPVKPLGAVKIGAAAIELKVSTDALRSYEREGLVIPFLSPAGTRWYSPLDIEWLRKIRGLLGEGLNFEGIRRLLAQIPCWDLKPCTVAERNRCPQRLEARVPCWAAPERECPEELKDCYHCAAYRQAHRLVNLKMAADIVPLEIS